jgi:hypothetical protein
MSGRIPKCCKAHARHYAQMTEAASQVARLLRDKLSLLDPDHSGDEDLAIRITQRLDESTERAMNTARQARFNHCPTR